MINVYVGKLAQAYTRDITTKSLPKMIYLMQHHDDGLLVIGWHDRQGQYRRVLGWMCLYVP